MPLKWALNVSVMNMIGGRLVVLLCAISQLGLSCVWAQDDVVALVGNEKITKKYVAAVRTTLPKYLLIKDQDLIKLAIRRRIISIEARRLGLDKESDIKALLYAYRDEILSKAYWLKVGVKEFHVSDDVVRSYYFAHPEKYKLPQMVRLLWLKSNNSVMLKKVKRKIAALPVSRREEVFENEARHAFEDQFLFASMGQGWDTRLIKVTHLPLKLREALKGAKRGKIIGPLSISGKYYLFFVKENVPPRKISLGVAREQIEAHLLRDKQEKFMKKRVEELEKRYNVKFLEH